MDNPRLDTLLEHLRKLIGSRGGSALTDGQLVERFAACRDEAAFELLVRRHSPLVWNVCHRVLGNAADADDAFQATFLVLVRNAAGLDLQRSVAPWLFGVARRIALRARATRSRVQEKNQQLARPEGVSEEPGTGELRQVLDEELDRLPEKYRAPVVLCYLEGKTHEEAALQLCCPLNTFKSRILRARNRLRTRLTRRGLAFSAGLLAAALAEEAGAAAVPPTLVYATVNASLLFAGGQTVAAGALSSSALTLARGALRMMFITKLKIAAAVLLTVGLATAGAGIIAYQTMVVQAVAADTPKAEVAAAPRPDVYGDPLPQGAKMRFGTLRLRHGGPAYFVGFAAKGKELVTASDDGTVRVWELPSGRELRRIGKQEMDGSNGSNVGGINGMAVTTFPLGPSGLHLQPGGRSVALSADGQTIAVASRDGNVRLYEVATGKEGAQIQASGGVARMVFAPDGKSLATCGNDGVIHQWELATAKEMRKYGTGSNVNQSVVVNGQLVSTGGGGAGLAFSPDGKRIASSKSILKPGQPPLGQVQIWSVETGKEVQSIRDDEANGSTIAFAPDSKTLAWAAENGRIRLFDSDNGKEIRSFGQQDTSVTGLAFSPDGKSLAAHDTDALVRVYDLENGKELRQLGDKEADPSGGGSQSLAYSPDGQTLAVTRDNSVRLWTLATGKEILPVASGHRGGVSSLVVSADGKTMTSLGADSVVRQWDMATGKELRQFKVPAEASAAVFSPSGALLAFCMANHIQVWDVAKGSEAQRMKLPADPAKPGRLAFTPDGKMLASRWPEGLAVGRFGKAESRLWDVASGAEVLALDEPVAKEDDGNPGGPQAVPQLVSLGGRGSLGIAFSSDGARVATVSTKPDIRFPKPMVRFWNVLSGKQVREFAIDGQVSAFVLAPDESSLATLNNGRISIWEVASGQERCQIKLGGPAQLLAFAGDGHTLAVASDRKVSLYDVRTGKELGTFDGHQGLVESLAFAPDGSAVHSGSADSTILSWDLTRLSKEGRPQAAALDAKQTEARWNELAGNDAKKAYEAIVALSLDPKQASYLKDHIKPAVGVDAKRIDGWIAELGDDNFQVRQRAADELQKLGEPAQPALDKVLKGQLSLETKKRVEALLEKIVTGKEDTPAVLQALRGVEVLGMQGTAEARQVLEKIAQGAAGARLTRAAQASLNGLSQRAK